MSGNGGPGPGGDAPRQRAEWVDTDSPADEVRIGESRLVRGGATVSIGEDAPAAEEPPAGGRAIGDAEIVEKGLFTERVIEIGELREEAVVSKQAVVREELVVRKNVEERTERIADTLRRTEVDVERLEPAADGEEDAGSQAR